jgi:uncharacterized protein (DUF1501 family)
MEMTMKRRELLKALACTGAATASGLRNLSFAANPSNAPSTLVVVFLRGGADSLHMAAPVDDAQYIGARPADLRILDSGNTPGIRLTKPFATNRDCRIHPAAAPLSDLFGSGHAQLLHACGLANATRSHFEAQEILESSLPSKSGTPNASDGWLTAYVRGSNAVNASAIQYMGNTPGQIRSLLGLRSGLSVTGELRNALSLPGDALGRTVLEALYGADAKNTDAATLMGQQTLSQIALIDAKAPRVDGRVAPYTPAKGVTYNTENYEWQQACQTVAQLIRMEVGLQVACLDFGGWDTHEYQSGKINNLVRQWSANLRALFDDVSASGHAMSVVVVSEFGRRLKANASGGTDHGHGGAMWLLDTQARQLLPATQWPGLESQQLDQGLDLQQTKDIKQVLASLGKRTLST